MKNRGVALIFNLFLITLLLILGVAVSRMIYSSVSALFFQRDQMCAFYLAEAGVEYGKLRLAGDPSFTTPPLRQALGEGYFIIEKAKAKPLLSSGHFRSAHVIMEYDNAIHHYSNL
jgi:Tfp pilus assembly protein PilX